MIYLDNASTTRVADEVLEAMQPWFADNYGNPGSIHGAGRKAKVAVDTARKQVGRLFGCDPEHIVFTSGGTEGNNLVIKGLAERLRAQGKTHMVISAVEHDSVRKAAESLIKHGFELSFAEPDEGGRITSDSVVRVLRPDTGFVSVVHTNNETGIVNEIPEIGDVCLSRNILFHSDCVQAAGETSVNVDDLRVDFATISSHKIYGPKGVGAIYSRDMELMPLISGGVNQEFGLRGGTENVPGIVGFGAACELAKNDLTFSELNLTMRKQEFVKTLLDTLNMSGNWKDSGVAFNANSHLAPGKILSVRTDGVFGETLVLMLDTMDIYVSAGSACRSHEAAPSPALLASGLTEEQARSTIRVSFSKYSTQEEVCRAAIGMAACIQTLRAIGKDDADG